MALSDSGRICWLASLVTSSIGGEVSTTTQDARCRAGDGVISALALPDLSAADPNAINSIAFGAPDTVVYGVVDNIKRFDGAAATALVAPVTNTQAPATLTISANSGQLLLDATLTRDALGRITSQTDTIAATSAHTTDYGYDLAGHLQQVTRDGVPSATYSYDANGNRLSKTTPAGTVNASYDDQDRLLSYGPNSYSYTADGALQSMLMITNIAPFEDRPKGAS